MGDRGAIATMDRRARLLLPTAFVLFAASAVVLVLQGSALMKGVILTEGAKLAIGALIFVRKPGNVVGMLLVIIGAGFAVTFGLDVLATSFVESGRVDIASWIVYLFGPFSLLFIVLQSAILLLFPHGRFSSSGDRRFMWGVSIYFAAFVVFSVFASPSSLTDPTAESLPHPFITASWTADLSELAFPLGGVLILSFLVAAVRLVMRSRRVGYGRAAPDQVGGVGVRHLLGHRHDECGSGPVRRLRSRVPTRRFGDVPRDPRDDRRWRSSGIACTTSTSSCRSRSPTSVWPRRSHCCMRRWSLVRCS
jgi:hypothetical protein